MSQALLFSDGIPSVSVHNGRPATTSCAVAQYFNKRHDDVLRSIRTLLNATPQNFRLRNFAESSYTNEQGREQPMYILCRDGFTLLVMGYTGPDAIRFKLAYLEAFNAMEAELAALKSVPVPTNKPRASDLLSSLGLSEDVLTLNRSLRVRLLGIAARVALMDPEQESRLFATFGKLCIVATAHRREEQDESPASRFVRERLVPSRGQIQARKLYEAFTDWCYGMDITPCSMRRFCASLRAVFPVRESNRLYFQCAFVTGNALSVEEADHA